TIAGQLALSLENIRLYAEVQERLRETQTLLAVAEALSQPGTPDEVMRRVTREIGRATTADTVGACFMNETKDALVMLAGYRALASTLDLEAMLRHFMRETARTLGVDTMAFWTLAEDGEWLEPFAAYHVPKEHLEQLRTLRVSTVKDVFYAEAVQRRRPAISV